MGSVKTAGWSAPIAAFAGLLFLVPSSHAQLNCNVGVEYYPDGGGIKRCVLNGHHALYTAKGLKVTCADGKALTQYPDGSVKSCSIEKSHTFDHVRCEAPSEVAFEPDGGFRSCERLSQWAVCGHASILEASAAESTIDLTPGRSVVVRADANPTQPHSGD